MPEETPENITAPTIEEKQREQAEEFKNYQQDNAAAAKYILDTIEIQNTKDTSSISKLKNQISTIFKGKKEDLDPETQKSVAEKKLRQSFFKQMGMKNEQQLDEVAELFKLPPPSAAISKEMRDQYENQLIVQINERLGHGNLEQLTEEYGSDKVRWLFTNIMNGSPEVFSRINGENFSDVEYDPGELINEAEKNGFSGSVQMDFDNKKFIFVPKNLKK